MGLLFMTNIQAAEVPVCYYPFSEQILQGSFFRNGIMQLKCNLQLIRRNRSLMCAPKWEVALPPNFLFFNRRAWADCQHEN